MNDPALPTMPDSGAPLIAAVRDCLQVFETVYERPSLLRGRAWFLLELARMLAVEADRIARMPELMAVPPGGVRCSFCGVPVTEVNFTIHRDGFGEGPEVPLCDLCGGEETPTLAEIWERIAQQEGS